ncbi:MAG: hypothetical protein QNJ38_02810, partial [Prochloraceae cyanobacterium]|nr:hypothetical protein [Prochloraceae cyanobacterium]
KWQSEWLLSETNAELKRILVQGIGYKKICQELPATRINNWQEYTLLKIVDFNINEEKIEPLKMTCSTTNKIHVLRVTPTLNSAREVIRWVNWGIASEDFLVQT